VDETDEVYEKIESTEERMLDEMEEKLGGASCKIVRSVEKAASCMYSLDCS
jgi:hypothetical protein